MTQNQLIHLETITQIFFGNIIALVILYFYGMTLTQSLSLQVIFFITSYVRSYFIRKMFSKLGGQILSNISCSPFRPSKRSILKYQIIEILEDNELSDEDIGKVVKLLYETYLLGKEEADNEQRSI